MALNITLRERVDADAPILFGFYHDEVAMRMAAIPMREEAAFLEHWAKVQANPSATTRVIEMDGMVVGDVVSFEQDGAREVGYLVGREHWGKGIASEALRQFLAIERTRPLHAVVAGHNLGSLRVLEKCGFTKTGTFRADDAWGAEIELINLVLR